MKLEVNNIFNIKENDFNNWNDKFIDNFNDSVATADSETINEIDKDLKILFSNELVLKGYEDIVVDGNDRRIKFFKYKRIDVDHISNEIKKEFPKATKNIFDDLSNCKNNLNGRLSLIKELLTLCSSYTYKEISDLIDKYTEDSKKDIYSLSSYNDKENTIILYNQAISSFAEEFNIGLTQTYEIAYIQSLFIKCEYEKYVYNPKPIFKYSWNFDKYLGIILDLLKTYFFCIYLIKEKNKNADLLNKIFDVLKDNYLLNDGLRLREFPYMGFLDFMNDDNNKSIDKLQYVNHYFNKKKLGSALIVIFSNEEYKIEKLLDLMYEELGSKYFD